MHTHTHAHVHTDTTAPLIASFSKSLTPPFLPQLPPHLVTYTTSTHQTSRFDKHGSYAAKSSSSEPGPGAYASPIQNHFQKFSVSTGAPRPTSSKGRVDFGPAGEGVGAIYEVKSSFDASGTLKRGPTSCFGSSNRFEGQGAYAKPTASPGPGAYTNREEVLKRSAPKATFASPRMRPPGWHNRPRSASALNSSSNSYLR